MSREALLEKIKKAERLEQVWALSKECRKFIRENTTVWIDHDHEMERLREEEKRNAQKEKAKRKQEEFQIGRERKMKVRKIEEMLVKIPRVEAERIEKEVKQGERQELLEMRKTLRVKEIMNL